MQRYKRKNPGTIYAIRWIGSNEQALNELLDKCVPNLYKTVINEHGGVSIILKTEAGVHCINLYNSWLVYQNRMFFVFTDDEFNEDFEVEDK